VLQARDLLKVLDQDSDGVVSLSDWTTSWEPLKASASDEDFAHIMCAVLHGLHMPVDSNPAKKHPHYPCNNREYLTTNIAPLLEQGLAATLEVMAEAHMMAASRELWDEDGYLPHKYKPPCPVRFLGEWLQARQKPPPPPEEDPLQCDWGYSVPLHEMTRTMKIKAVFLHLDRPQTGFAPTTAP
jgi:hypothetical protein